MKKRDDINQNAQRIEELEKQVEEWKIKYLRALADYQNLEKRKNDEVKEIRRFAGEMMLVRLLPIVDTFERALKHSNDQGLAIALKEFAGYLTELGVKKIDVVGKTFNPHEMECIEVVEGEENKVIEELLPGYTLHGKIIRVAQVKVGKQNSIEAQRVPA